MALDQGALKNGLLALTASFPTSYSDAGRRWAEAYGAYAAAAMSSINGVPNVTGAIAVLASKLAGAFASGAAAPAMDAAFVAFWLAPPVAFAGAFPGVITAVGSVVGFAAIFAHNISGKASADAACGTLAAGIHAFTLTVICTTATTPTPTVGPIH